VAYSLREREDLEEEEIAETVMEKLELVGLANVHAKYPPQLSGGQKKRVGLARALANSPEIILYDEPTTGLDPTAIRLIDELILKLKENFGITQVAVTHDISSAKRFSDRWILLNEGRVIADGPVHEVTSNNQDV